MKRGRSPECIGDLRFDQWRAGELSTEDDQNLKQHLAGCGRCRERQALHDQARERYQATVTPAPAWLVRAPEPKPRGVWRRIARGSLLTVGIASAGVAALQLQPLALELPHILAWGSSHARKLPFISFYVRGPGADGTQPGMHGQLVQRGERIHFTYTAGAPRYLAILSLDGTDGAAYASVDYPRDSPRAARIGPGSDVPLPIAIAMDETPGETSIFALFCARAFELEPVREALELEWSSLPAPAGCSLQEITVTRR